MSILEILLLGIGLSMDAFAVSICKGLSAKRLQTRHYLIIGAWFGGFQALMPTIGFFLGSTFEQYITAFDHWVAFVLLSAIGANVDGKRTAMVYLVVEVVGIRGRVDLHAALAVSAVLVLIGAFCLRYGMVEAGVHRDLVLEPAMEETIDLTEGLS